ncbi:hypothetical protein KAI04_03645 [Candidatus Pacearchaeota archaeon]|nr:hypothetical protein [Candidatus Pacearchaeota archaeon]
MDNLTIPASMTLEKGISIKRYKWKSKNRESIYKKKCRRAFIRFTCKNFAYKIKKRKKEKRQISISFIDDSNVEIKRIKNKGISLQGYAGKHPYIQIVVNKALPNDLWRMFKDSNKKTLTIPVHIKINLSEWKEFNLTPDDFLLEIEKEAKTLMQKALKKGFKVNHASKGRSHDLCIINPNNKEIIIAISSHTAKSQSRSKEKTIQKILMDISKMLSILKENTTPVIITKPIKFENSWSFTTHKYLEFYKEKFGFKFLTTEFKKNWEDDIISELLKI